MNFPIFIKIKKSTGSDKNQDYRIHFFSKLNIDLLFYGAMAVGLVCLWHVEI